MPPQRKKREKGKEKKVEQLWGWTQAAEACASDAGHCAEAAANCDWSHDARPGAVRSQPVSSPRRSPTAGRAVPRTRRPPGRPRAEVTGLGRWGASERVWLRSPGVVPLLSPLTQTLLQKGGNLSNNNSQQRDLTPALPSLSPPRPAPAPSLGPQRAPSASQPAVRCRQFRIQSFSTHFVLFFYKKRGNPGGGQPGTHTPALIPQQKQMHFDF